MTKPGEMIHVAAMEGETIKDAVKRIDAELQRAGAGVKPPLSYVLDFDRALILITQVMEKGAKKYSRNNWKNGGPNASLPVLLDSVMRHLVARQNGETHDAECGTDHLANACCGLLFALYHHGQEPKK